MNNKLDNRWEKVLLKQNRNLYVSYAYIKEKQAISATDLTLYLDVSKKHACNLLNQLVSLNFVKKDIQRKKTGQPVIWRYLER